MAARERTAWHSRSAAEVLTELGCDADRGLSKLEAEARLDRFGENELVVRGVDPWYRVLARQYADVLIAILGAAAVVSFLVGEPLDAAAILAVLVINGLLGFLQEWKASRAIEALGRMLAPRCAVVRDGAETVIPAAELVPGDVVVLAEGNRIPADLRIFDAFEVRTEESALTGESASTPKRVEPVEVGTPLADRASMAWMGTIVTGGRGRAVVVATGMSTEFGKIAELTQAIESAPTPLQRRLGVLGRQLGLLAVSVGVLVFAGGWLLGREPVEMFMTGISLAVAVVPEGLPAVVTVTLALGVRAMVRRRALPRRLQATETLGSTTTILTDKTGTLTRGEMTLRRLWLPAGAVDVTGAGYDPEGDFRVGEEPIEVSARPDLVALLESGTICNHARLELEGKSWSPVGEPTEVALVVAAAKAGIEPPRMEPELELPFRSARKRMTLVCDGLAHVKGAPEVLLERCTRVLCREEERVFDEVARAEATEAYREFARDGLRTLAIARRALPQDVSAHPDDIECELTLLGIAGIHDPPRPEVPKAVAQAKGAGIRVIMLTGDAAETALAIARMIGLAAERAVEARELDLLDDEELLKALGEPAVFARTTPEQKLRIARLLEERGEVVGMTGDGVNDAPALKEADIGIAMGIRGTDVAREAADLVLTDDNFATIVNAIREGRRQHDNIQKFVRYLLSSNIGEVVAILLTALFRGPLILLPVQILWINVVTDAVTAVALGLEPPEGDLMRRPPRPRRAPIVDRTGYRTVVALGGYIGLATLILFYVYLGDDVESRLPVAQTVAFTAMIVFEQINLFNFRALRTPLAEVGFFSNPWLLVALAATVGLHLMAVYVPFMQAALHTTGIGLTDWLLILAVGLPLFLFVEGRKILASRARRG